MGFDLTGKMNETIPQPDWDLEYDHPDIREYFKKREEVKGAYFRANCWSWRAIPELVYKLDLITQAELNTDWAYNDFAEIEKVKSKDIGFAIRDWLDCMVQEKELTEEDLDKYVLTYDGQIMGEVEFREVWCKLPENQEECSICNGTGDRTDGVIKGDWKKQCNGCNGCHGEGMVGTWETKYYTFLDHLKEFADFACASGGFNIG